jgi:hypothetical protein
MPSKNSYNAVLELNLIIPATGLAGLCAVVPTDISVPPVPVPVTVSKFSSMVPGGFVNGIFCSYYKRCPEKYG